MFIDTPLEIGDLLLGLIVAVLIMIFAFVLTRNVPERNTILSALLAKLIASLAYCYIQVSQANASDSVVYHYTGIGYANGLRADLASGSASYFFSHPFYWLGVNNRENIIGWSGLLHVLLLDSFLATSFIFALLGFVGQWLIYKTFVSYYPDVRLRVWWRAGILFFPTLVFWSSGILKDSLGILGLGCAVWGVRHLVEKYNHRYLALTIYGMYTLFIFRAQIVPALFAALIPWIVQRTGMSRRAGGMSTSLGMNPKLMNGLLLAGILIGFLALGVAVPRFSLVNLPHTIAELNNSFAVQQNLQTGVYSPVAPLVTDVSWVGLLRAWPSTLVLSLFRPFPWEAASLTARLAAAENSILLALTGRFFLQLFTYRGMFLKIFRSPLFLSCIIFVAIFAFGVGASTPNLGTVSRYRIPLIPFLMAAFIIVQYKVIEARDQKSTRETAVPVSAALSTRARQKVLRLSPRGAAGAVALLGGAEARFDVASRALERTFSHRGVGVRRDVEKQVQGILLGLATAYPDVSIILCIRIGREIVTGFLGDGAAYMRTSQELIRLPRLDRSKPAEVSRITVLSGSVLFLLCPELVEMISESEVRASINAFPIARDAATKISLLAASRSGHMTDVVVVPLRDPNRLSWLRLTGLFSLGT